MNRRRVIASAVVLATAGAAVALTIPAIASTEDRPAPAADSEMVTALRRDLGLTAPRRRPELRTERWAAAHHPAPASAPSPRSGAAPGSTRPATGSPSRVTDPSAAATVRAAGAQAKVVTRSRRRTRHRQEWPGPPGERGRRRGPRLVRRRRHEHRGRARPARGRWPRQACGPRETAPDRLGAGGPLRPRRRDRCSTCAARTRTSSTTRPAARSASRSSAASSAPATVDRSAAPPPASTSRRRAPSGPRPSPARRLQLRRGQRRLDAAPRGQRLPPAARCRSPAPPRRRSARRSAVPAPPPAPAAASSRPATPRCATPRASVTGLTRTDVCAEPGDSGGSVDLRRPGAGHHLRRLRRLHGRRHHLLPGGQRGPADSST